jgi:LysR family hydrogen peroxide-inducible transcriptional activator
VKSWSRWWRGDRAQAPRADEAERVKAVADHARHPLDGALRLGVIHTVAPYLLPEMITALGRLAPRMPLDIEENQTASLEAMLHEGAIDAAIVALPFAGPGIAVMPLYDETFRVIVPARHPWARRRAVRPDELATENLLLLTTGHCFRDQVLDTCREFARAAPPGKQGNSLETIRSMVTSGMGISVLRHCADAQVRDAIDPRDRLRRIAAVAPDRARVSRRVSAARSAGGDRRGYPEARFAHHSPCVTR